MTSRKSLLTGTILVAALLTGCKKQEAAPTQDYLIFGWYHGQCAGESCIDIFRLDKGAARLFEDSADRYPSSAAPYDGKYVLKTQAQYNQVAGLPAQLPAQLLTQPVGIIGLPDFADGGGYYVEVSDQGERKFWLIDRQKENIPTYLHPFVDELNARIKGLQ